MDTSIAAFFALVVLQTDACHLVHVWTLTRHRRRSDILGDMWGDPVGSHPEEVSATGQRRAPLLAKAVADAAF
jgi:hypothetical protein